LLVFHQCTRLERRADRLATVRFILGFFGRITHEAGLALKAKHVTGDNDLLVTPKVAHSEKGA